MATAFAYESRNDGRSRGGLAQALLIASAIFPELDRAHACVVGSETEQRLPIGGLRTWLMAQPGHWVATLLSSAGTLSDGPFLTSVPIMSAEDLPGMRGLYVITQAGMRLPQRKELEALAMLAEEAGPGFGYLADAPDAIIAVSYMSETEIIDDLNEIELYLVDRYHWRERFSSEGSHENCARNLYPVNIWPRQFVELIGKEPCFLEAVEKGEIKVLAEYGDIFVYGAREPANLTLAPVNAVYFHEEFSAMELRWPSGAGIFWTTSLE